MRVIVTAGGTREPVDGVRSLTNSSTGETGATIAGVLADRGAEVLLLRAAGTRTPSSPLESDTFETFTDLENRLQHHLSDLDWDAVIHLAAVSDYRVAALEVDGRVIGHGEKGKIPSGREVVIRLAPNPKLIDHIRSWSKNKAIQIVGFKLTNTEDPSDRAAQIRALLDRGTTDLVVHNDLGEIDGDLHPAEIWSHRGPFVRTASKIELAETLLEMLKRPQRPAGDSQEIDR